ncbi:MAG: hypothetical protein IT514_00285 [Burkholderiales bacterium]|nr:hypothetical protein [Burkholderiales bacterium]
MARALDLRITDAARTAIDDFMAGLEDEGVPALCVNRRWGEKQEHWMVGAYHTERIRFFEQLARVSGFDYFFQCDGLLFLLPYNGVVGRLEGRTLDYAFSRYLVR